MLNGTGFLIEWSTNALPDQSYGSADYSKLEPSPDFIRWVRFKKATLTAAESGTLFYRVIIR